MKDIEEAKRSPELAILSVQAHGAEPGGLDIAVAAQLSSAGAAALASQSGVVMSSKHAPAARWYGQLLVDHFEGFAAAGRGGRPCGCAWATV